MEKRNVQITIEQAKEWLKNDQLKEIALEAFPELKVKTFPKTWEELERINGYCTSISSEIIQVKGIRGFTIAHKNVFATKEQAEASIALAQLSQLKKVYNGDWEADWEDSKTRKYVIYFNKNKMDIAGLINSSEFLSFKDYKTAELFLENFKELILKAKPLMS
jgi:DNA/RNA endonuclease YhcR with UshA esterase domain